MIADKRARADARRKKPLARKPIVSNSHRRARDPQRTREIAARRQTVAGTQTAVSNRTPYLPVDLPTQVFASDEIDVQVHWRGKFSVHKLAQSKKRELDIAPVLFRL